MHDFVLTGLPLIQVGVVVGGKKFNKMNYLSNACLTACRIP